MVLNHWFPEELAHIFWKEDTSFSVFAILQATPYLNVNNKRDENLIFTGSLSVDLGNLFR